MLLRRDTAFYSQKFAYRYVLATSKQDKDNPQTKVL